MYLLTLPNLFAGAVYGDKLFLVTPVDARLRDAMRVYDFGKQEWALLELAERPPAGDNVLLGVYEDQLIQFAGVAQSF